MRPLDPEPFDDGWHRIFYGPGHTGQTWACITVAIAHADAVLAQTAGTSTAGTRSGPGGSVWREAAATHFQTLLDSGAYRHDDSDPPARVTADLRAAHTWLTAPVAAHGLERTTIADRLEVDDEFVADDEYRPARLAKLIAAAQDMGVLRADGAQLELWHIATDDGDLDGHRIAVRRDDGVILASSLLAVDDIADDTLAGVDAAVNVLQQTATIANEVLTLAGRAEAMPTATAPARNAHTEAHAGHSDELVALPAWVEGFRPAGRAFPPPSTTLGAAIAAPPPTDPVMGRPPPRSRS